MTPGVDDRFAAAATAPDDRPARLAAAGDRPGPFVDAGPEQEQVARPRGVLGGFKTAERVGLGPRASSGARGSRGGGERSGRAAAPSAWRARKVLCRCGPIRVRERELQFVLGAGLKKEHAAGEQPAVVGDLEPAAVFPIKWARRSTRKRGAPRLHTGAFALR